MNDDIRVQSLVPAKHLSGRITQRRPSTNNAAHPALPKKKAFTCNEGRLLSFLKNHHL